MQSRDVLRQVLVDVAVVGVLRQTSSTINAAPSAISVQLGRGCASSPTIAETSSGPRGPTGKGEAVPFRRGSRRARTGLSGSRPLCRSPARGSCSRVPTMRPGTTVAARSGHVIRFRLTLSRRRNRRSDPSSRVTITFGFRITMHEAGVMRARSRSHLLPARVGACRERPALDLVAQLSSVEQLRQ